MSDQRPLTPEMMRTAARTALFATERYLANGPVLLLEMAVSVLRGALEANELPRKCNPHPDAPHAFARDASHAAGRYVCECEGWRRKDAS